MNLRKLRKERAAANATVEGSTVKALPPGDAKVDARTIDVEPLTAPAAGREEAREAFVRDAAAGDAAPPPAEGSAPSSSSSAPAGDGPPQVTVESVTKMGVAMLDGAATMFGPKLVGGNAELWAQSEKETANLELAARPVVAKFMTEMPITPEAMLLGALAFMYVPRAFAGVMERAAEKRARRNHGAAHETVDARHIAPPAPPPPVAAAPPPPPPAPEPAAAPPPVVKPVDEPTSVHDFLRSIRGGK